MHETPNNVDHATRRGHHRGQSSRASITGHDIDILSLQAGSTVHASSAATSSTPQASVAATNNSVAITVTGGNNHAISLLQQRHSASILSDNKSTAHSNTRVHHHHPIAGVVVASSAHSTGTSGINTSGSSAMSDDDFDTSDTVRRSSMLIGSPHMASLVDVDTAWNGVVAAQRELERQMQLLLHATVHVHADASMGALMPSALNTPEPPSPSITSPPRFIGPVQPHLPSHDSPSRISAISPPPLRSPLDYDISTGHGDTLTSDTAAYLQQLSSVKNRTAQMLSTIRNEYRPLRAAMASLRSIAPNYPVSQSSLPSPQPQRVPSMTEPSNSSITIAPTASVSPPSGPSSSSPNDGSAAGPEPLEPLTVNVNLDTTGSSMMSPSMVSPRSGDDNPNDSTSQSSRVRQASLQRLITTSVNNMRSPTRQRPRSIIMFQLRGKRHLMSQSSTVEEEDVTTIGSAGAAGDSGSSGGNSAGVDTRDRSRTLSNFTHRRRTTELPPAISGLIDAARRAAAVAAANNSVEEETKESLASPSNGGGTTVTGGTDAALMSSASLHDSTLAGMMTTMRTGNLAARLRWVQAIRTIAALVREVKTNSRTPLAAVQEAQRKTAASMVPPSSSSSSSSTPATPSTAAATVAPTPVSATSTTSERKSVESSTPHARAPEPTLPAVSHRFVDYFVAFSVVPRGTVTITPGGTIVEDMVGMADTGEDEAIRNSDVTVLRRCHPAVEYPEFPLPANLSLFCLGTRPRTRTPVSPHVIAAAKAAAAKQRPTSATVAAAAKAAANGQQRRGSVTSQLSEAPQYFSFVLTDFHGDRVFASCVHYYQPITPGAQLWGARCLVLVSHYPFLTAFRRSLVEMHRMVGHPIDAHKPSPEQMVSLITQEVPLPVPGGPRIRYQWGDSHVTTSLPSANEFPLLNFGLDTFFTLFSVSNVITLFQSALSEQKIILHSFRLERLALVADSLLALIFPFRWYHTYIPILPLPLLDVAGVPGSYIIGMQTKHLEQLDDDTKSYAVIANLDANTVTMPTNGGLPSFPTHLFARLKDTLRHLLDQKQTLDRQRMASLHDNEKKRKAAPPLETKSSSTLSLFGSSSSSSASSSPAAPSSVLGDMASSGMVEDHYGDDDDEWATSGRHFQYGVRKAFFDLFPILLRNYRKCVFFMGDGVPIFNAESYLRMREDDEDFAQLFDAINAPSANGTPSSIMYGTSPPSSIGMHVGTPNGGSGTSPGSSSSFLPVSSPAASEAIGRAATGRKPADIKKREKVKVMEEKAKKEAEAKEKARYESNRLQQKESAHEVLQFLKHFLSSQLFAFFLEDSSHDSIFHDYISEPVRGVGGRMRRRDSLSHFGITARPQTSQVFTIPSPPPIHPAPGSHDIQRARIVTGVMATPAVVINNTPDKKRPFLDSLFSPAAPDMPLRHAQRSTPSSLGSTPPKQRTGMALPPSDSHDDSLLRTSSMVSSSSSSDDHDGHGEWVMIDDSHYARLCDWIALRDDCLSRQPRDFRAAHALAAAAAVNQALANGSTGMDDNELDQIRRMSTANSTAAKRAARSNEIDQLQSYLSELFTSNPLSPPSTPHVGVATPSSSSSSSSSSKGRPPPLIKMASSGGPSTPSRGHDSQPATPTKVGMMGISKTTDALPSGRQLPYSVPEGSAMLYDDISTPSRAGNAPRSELTAALAAAAARRPVVDKRLADCIASLKLAAVRVSLARVLSAPSNNRKLRLSTVAFRSLRLLVWNMLTQCQDNHDWSSAKLVLEAGGRFYHEQQRGANHGALAFVDDDFMDDGQLLSPMMDDITLPALRPVVLTASQSESSVIHRSPSSSGAISLASTPIPSPTSLPPLLLANGSRRSSLSGDTNSSAAMAAAAGAASANGSGGVSSLRRSESGNVRRYRCDSLSESTTYFLERAIRKHGICSLISLWEASYLEEVEHAHQAHASESLSPLNKKMTPQESADNLRNLLIGRLSRLTHLMLTFGQSEATVAEFILAKCNLLGLSEEESSTIRILIANIAMAVRVDEEAADR